MGVAVPFSDKSPFLARSRRNHPVRNFDEHGRYYSGTLHERCISSFHGFGGGYETLFIRPLDRGLADAIGSAGIYFPVLAYAL